MENKELKIVSLNTWGGQVDSFLDFFKSNKDVDVFCLQEVLNFTEEEYETLTKEGKAEELDMMNYGLFSDIENILNNYNSYYRPHYRNNFGLAIFVKKELEVEKETEIFVYKQRGFGEDIGNCARNLQSVTLKINDNKINILTVHGLWAGKSKDDNEDRIKQSQNIIDFIKTLEGETVLCGDFNLNPDTESIKMFENFSLKNLIREKNIASTRTSLYIKDENPFADYTFVSKDVEVKSFEIMPHEVSDHSAMKLVITV